MAQSDPSHTVPQDLMPHVHLVSSYRYPTMPRIDMNEVAKWLMTAPQIARDRAPFFWTYLDKPADGTILLTWQPLQRLGTNFATDGFVWAPPEQVYKHDLGNGLILEIYYLKAGYIPGEQFALHTRRRFRLVPAPGHPNPPQLDVSLFIVHYGPSEQNDRIPASMVPYDDRVTTIMQQRHFLLRGGQIRRKEFMLSDHANWPSLPELTRQQMGPQMAPRGVPQQMAYPPQPAPGPPSKRARHSQSHSQQQQQQQHLQQQQQQPPVMPGMNPLDSAFDDDEDISRGDMFDHLTPREISLLRYQQNHEWMEEILSSAYRIGQIQPSDLNLGLKGELASLTEGIFTAQAGDVFAQPPEKPYVGRLDSGLADEFRKRVSKHVESTEAEIERLREEHAELVASLKQNSALKVKEKQIRSIPDPPVPEVFNAELGLDGAEEQRAPAPQPVKTPFDDILKEVEAATGRKVDIHPVIKRVQDGGYQAPAPKPPTPVPTTQMSRQPSHSGSQNSGLMMGDSDMDMGGTAAGLLDQMHTGFSSTSTPVNNFPTPQAQASAAQSNAPTPSNAHNVASPAPALPTVQEARTGPVQHSHPEPAGDVAMSGTESHARAPAETAADQGTDSGDWVVVPKGGASPEVNAPSSVVPAAAVEASGGQAEQQKPVPIPTKPMSAAATPAVTDGGSASFDQNDFSSLGDLDTAGDAMAGYDAPGLDGTAGALGEDLDLQMDMDDSAFGDAFHVDSSGTPGDAHNQDM
ncbi:uncharacterized protein MAM_06809 [Metarhizium album ARSEF 1941]|uniref:DUF1750-domain-containing protein n=1 Tax=Metarhizium album (strain ARSEF 1941) TaxID=1081103 RepID=A0A0B2WQR5_METAS|nr:uncharacterized protein MAM_06809 [Metarhizium album ARSEF 1941]KHN95305.1 hypothetical protein MAM_06809 [Metarhizium album ARSEF 1941]